MGRHRHTIEMCLGFFHMVSRDRTLPAPCRRRAEQRGESARDLLTLVDTANLGQDCHTRLLQREARLCVSTVRELARGQGLPTPVPLQTI